MTRKTLHSVQGDINCHSERSEESYFYRKISLTEKLVIIELSERKLIICDQLLTEEITKLKFLSADGWSAEASFFSSRIKS